jgi:5-formyltetrahydrofolate cyclo-ligase
MKGVAGDPRVSKVALREECRRRLRDLPASERDADSERIRQHCRALPEWGAARVLALYHPRPDEPDLWPLAAIAWAEGRQVVLPSHDPARGAYRWRRVTGPGDLVTGRFGIPEPAPCCEEVVTPLLDLAFVPGLGFSEDGVRLGRGQGFYDRLLESFRGRSFGVAFDRQLLPRIPREDHDFGLDGVIIPSGCRFAPTGAK